MVQPRQVSPWPLLCILACLFVLSMASPRLWDRVSEPDSALATRQPVHTVEPLAPSDWQPSLVETRPGDTVPAAPEADWDEATDAEPQTDQAEAVVATDSLSEEPDAAPQLISASRETEPEPVRPAGKIGSQPTAIPSHNEVERSLSAGLEESIQRLPILMAKIPSPRGAVPQSDIRPSEETDSPTTNRPDALSHIRALEREYTECQSDNSWQEPETLLQSLDVLAKAGPTSVWAAEVAHQVRALGPAADAEADRTTAILERLAELREQSPQLAGDISNRTLARELLKVGYALGRRLDLWQKVARLNASALADRATPNTDRYKLALCLAEVDALTGDSAEGQAWRKYLLVDALEKSAQREPSPEDRAMQKLAQRVLVRLVQTPLTPRQQEFVATGPVAALRTELRHWAAEPVSATAVLRDIEDYERTGFPSNARRVALDCQHLSATSVDERRALAERIDLHYRNANVRIAVTGELANKLIPERDLEYAPVVDTVLGRPVRGESLMATEVAVRMTPDPNNVRMALEVTGEIASLTTARAGSAKFHNDSESYYIARKPLQIDMQGIRVWPVEISVANRTRLRGIDTPLDSFPLIGQMVKNVARSQMEQNKPEATREVRRKVAAKARERIDTETRERLAQVVQRMNERVFDPLNSLSLDPRLIAAETTEERFVMRLRLAGEDQLGSHTPRPRAYADSLASLQIHESAINNGIQRLRLNGRTFTLLGLSQHIATRLNRPVHWEITPEHGDVKIRFAEKDAVVVRCQDGQLVLTLSISRLSKSPRLWKEFQIRAFYRPEVNGRSAELVRDGVIHLIGNRLNLGSQIALRGIFSHALSKDNPWNLVPEQIVNEPKLHDAAITQFVIDDGWIGVSLGPKHAATTTAQRPRHTQ